MNLVVVTAGLGLGIGGWLVLNALMSLSRSTQRPKGTSSSFRMRLLPGLSRLNRLLAGAGFERVDPLIALIVALSVGAIIGWSVTLVIPIPILGVMASVAAPLLLVGYVVKVRDARAARLRRAWPGLLDHLRAGIRSGQDVAGAVMGLPENLPADIAGPISLFRADVNRGMGTDESLVQLRTRLADPVGDRIIEVLRMTYEVGGIDSPGVLLSLQKTIRADIAVRDDAHAKQSWIRSASVLAVSAPWVVLVVIGTREATTSAYQSAEGSLILLLGGVVSGVAYLMMRNIGALPGPRRWLG